MTSVPPICIVAFDRDLRPDAVLAEVCRSLQESGLVVGGLLQDERTDPGTACATLFLEDIATGRRVGIFENRGAGTKGCRLDPAGLAQAAGWLREAVEAAPDVVFVNRFGRQEAEGRGLRDEIGAAVASELPVVVAVGEALLPAWRDFAGPEGTILPVEAGAIEGWCRSRARVRVA